MSDSKSLNTSLLEVIISSKNEHVFMHDLSDHSFQIIVDIWGVSMTLGLKWPVVWNISRHVALWQICLHCRIDKTGSHGIISLVCHHDLHYPFTTWDLLNVETVTGKAHIGMLNELTESDVTEWHTLTVDETALAIVNKQGCQRVTIVSSQRKIMVTI